MAYSYATIAATALRLIKRFGAPCTIGLTGLTARTVLGVRTKTVNHDLLDSKVQVGDYEYVIAAVDSTGADSAPKEGERISVAGDDRVIMLVNVVKPGATTLIYYVYARIG